MIGLLLSLQGFQWGALEAPADIPQTASASVCVIPPCRIDKIQKCHSVSELQYETTIRYVPT